MWCRGKNLISAGIGSRKSFLCCIFGGRFSLKHHFGEIDGGGVSRNVKFPDINECSQSTSQTTFSRNKLWLVTLISCLRNNYTAAKDPAASAKTRVGSTSIHRCAAEAHVNAMTTRQNRQNLRWRARNSHGQSLDRRALIASEYTPHDLQSPGRGPCSLRPLQAPCRRGSTAGPRRAGRRRHARGCCMDRVHNAVRRTGLSGSRDRLVSAVRI